MTYFKNRGGVRNQEPITQAPKNALQRPESPLPYQLHYPTPKNAIQTKFAVSETARGRDQSPMTLKRQPKAPESPKNGRFAPFCAP